MIFDFQIYGYLSSNGNDYPIGKKTKAAKKSFPKIANSPSASAARRSDRKPKPKRVDSDMDTTFELDDTNDEFHGTEANKTFLKSLDLITSFKLKLKG
jgi:hypothetical protein